MAIEKQMIHTKITSIMGKIGAIGKNQNNTMQKYKFRGIDDMYNALNKHLADEGVYFTSEVMDMQREERKTKSGGALIYTTINMKWTAYAEDGSSVTTQTIGEAMDSGDKSCNKAMSAAYKYALMQIFCIPTEELKDSDTESHEVASRTETEEIEMYTNGLTKCTTMDQLQNAYRAIPKKYQLNDTVVAIKDEMKKKLS